MRPVATALALGLLLAGSGAARAQDMYRWLDAEGRVHFGSEPPADARSLAPWSPDGDRLKVDPKAAGAAPARRPEAAVVPAAAPTAAPEAEEKLGGRSETQWRAQARLLEKRIRDLEGELDALDETTQAYGGWGTHRDGRRIDRVPIRERRPELEKALDGAQSELDALEEEARRLGVPPGWLR
jgi:hypothetical protein